MLNDTLLYFNDPKFPLANAHALKQHCRDMGLRILELADQYNINRILVHPKPRFNSVGSQYSKLCHQ